MKARLFINHMTSGDRARNFLRLVRGPDCNPQVETLDIPRRGEARDILETIQNQNQPEDLDINIQGETLLKQMDSDLEDFGVVPYWYSDLARARGEGIYPGVSVIIAADPLRTRYRTIGVSFSHRAIRVTDGEHEYVLPWDLVMPAEGREENRPYWFAAQARDRGESLEIGDYVRVVGLEGKYELMDIFWAHGHVQIRAVGSDEYLGMPWRHIRPWEE